MSENLHFYIDFYIEMHKPEKEFPMLKGKEGKDRRDIICQLLTITLFDKEKLKNIQIKCKRHYK